MHAVLVVEDNHDIRVSLRDLLETNGFFVFSAATGIDGIAMLQRIKTPSVIILDQNMPLMNGEQFLKTIKQVKEWSDIPVIVISANENRCQTLGVQAFLERPVDAVRVLPLVKAHCPPLEVKL